MGKSNIAGAWGEALAAEYLRKKHYSLVAAGYYCKFGEIDLIVKDRKFLVFVEVKLRSNLSVGLPREFVDIRKQEKLRMAASAYMSMYELDEAARFDVAEVYADGNGKILKVEYMENAF